MVSGCYDLIHSGYIAFLKTAAAYGKLIVMIGQDRNLLQLNGKAPYFSEQGRKYLVGSIKYVYEAYEILQILSISLLDKTYIKEILTKCDYNNVKEFEKKQLIISGF